MLAPPSTALLIVPPADICDAVDAWRRRYDPQGEQIPPHITIAYPPFVSAEDWPVFSLELADLLQSVPPFAITLKEVGVFTGIPQILWLRPDQEGDLPRLRELLETRFADVFQPLPYAYTPHMTVGQFEESPGLATARAELQAGWQPLSFLVDRLFFAIQRESGRWQVRDFVRLGPPG